MSHTTALTEPDKAKSGRPKDSAKREEILAAATRLFMENGFELTSMEAVARQAGVSKLTIYSHFTDKNDLFCAIMQNRCIRLGMPESFMALADLSAEQALMQVASMAAAIIFHEDSLRLQRIIYAEAARHADIVKIFYQVGPLRIKTAFADLLRALDAQAKLSIADADRATEQFFSLIKGERLLRNLMMLAPPPDAETLAAHVKANVAFFLNAYRPQIPTATDPS